MAENAQARPEDEVTTRPEPWGFRAGVVRDLSTLPAWYLERVQRRMDEADATRKARESHAS